MHFSVVYEKWSNAINLFLERSFAVGRFGHNSFAESRNRLENYDSTWRADRNNVRDQTWDQSHSVTIKISLGCQKLLRLQRVKNCFCLMSILLINRETAISQNTLFQLKCTFLF